MKCDAEPIEFELVLAVGEVQVTAPHHDDCELTLALTMMIDARPHHDDCESTLALAAAQGWAVCDLNNYTVEFLPLNQQDWQHFLTNNTLCLRPLDKTVPPATAVANPARAAAPLQVGM